MIVRLKYVQAFKDRYGRPRLYFRRPGCKRITLPAQDDPSFHEAYAAALAASEPIAKTDRVVEGSIEAVSRSYLASSAYRQLAASTQRVYHRIIDDMVHAHGIKRVAHLQAQKVREMMEARSATPAAANHFLRTLRALMKHAIRQGLIQTDPTRDVDRLKEHGEGAETWSEEDIAAFEARWAAGTRPRLALALMLYTGQRRSDVVRMGRQHIRGDAIEVRQQKTGARLLIPLHAELADLIAIETDRLTFLMTERGAPFTPNGFYMRFAKWVTASGLPDGLSPHGLRKAAARRMAEAGCTAHQIAAVTGHKTLAEVQRYTLAADQERLARAAIKSIGRGRIMNKV